MRKIIYLLNLLILVFISFSIAGAQENGKRIYTLEISSDAADGKVVPGIPVHYTVRGFPDELSNEDVEWVLHDRLGFLIEDIASISDNGVLTVNSSARKDDIIIVEARIYNQWMTKIYDEEELSVTYPEPIIPSPQQQNEAAQQNKNEEDDDDFWEYGEGDGSLTIRNSESGMMGNDISKQTISFTGTSYILYADALFENGVRKLNFDWNVSDKTIAHIVSNYGSNMAMVVFDDEGTVNITARDRDDKNKTGSVTLHRYCPVINISLYDIDGARPGETIDIYGHVITSWNTVKQLRERNIVWSAAVNGIPTKELIFSESELNDLYPGFIAAKLHISEKVNIGDIITVYASHKDDLSVYNSVSFHITENNSSDRSPQPYLERIICTDQLKESEGVCENYVLYDEKYDTAAMNSSFCSKNSFVQIKAKVCDRHDVCNYIDKMAFVCTS